MTAPSIRSGRERGFSMVEVLVALVVLGVGMLGIASLYVVTLRTGGSAISRMQAVNLASDLGDRIRANRNAGEAYAALEAADDHDCVGGSSNCTPIQMAEEDLFWWQQQIEETLPGTASGAVEFIDGVPRTYNITVSWTEPGQDDDDPLTYTMSMQL